MNPLALLLLGLMVFYGWALAPGEYDAFAWNILGSVGRLVLVWALAYKMPVSLSGTIGMQVAAWWTAEELLVIGCNSLYIVDPWDVPEGQAMCSSLMHYDLGTVGVMIAAFLGWRIQVLRSRASCKV